MFNSKSTPCVNCQLKAHRCICPVVDKFFEECDSLRPFEKEKSLAIVVDLAEYRKMRQNTKWRVVK